MKLVNLSEDWNVLVLEEVTDDDAYILEILGCEHIDSAEELTQCEIWKRK